LSLISTIGSLTLKETIFKDSGYAKNLAGSYFSPVEEVFSSLIYAGLIHLGGLILGEIKESDFRSVFKEKFENTYTAFYFSIIPFILTSWIIEPLLFYNDIFWILSLAVIFFSLFIFFKNLKNLQKLSTLSAASFSFAIFILIFLPFPLTVWISSQPLEALGSGVVFKQSGDTVYVATAKHMVDFFAEGSCVGVSRFPVNTFLSSFLPSASAQADPDFSQITDQVINSIVVIHSIYNPREDAMKINFTTFNGTSHGADIVWKGTGPVDLAVVSFRESSVTKDFTVANSSKMVLKRAQDVIAIGAPFGFEYSVTRGIISSIREITLEGTTTEWIQTDTEINPGNSGGGLFDSQGNLIGINTCIVFSPNLPGSNSLKFAISINTLLDMVKI